MKNLISYLLIGFISISCSEKKFEKINSSLDFSNRSEVPFIWENANIYFLLTDRFYNGDTSNDINFNRDRKAGKLRGFEGGDLIGITKKIKEGYFNDLGVNAIWFSPVVEQIHGAVNEGTGITYGFHGYWAKDWTKLEPNFGTGHDLKNLVEEAHKHGIRVVLDGVINHTGPVTETDSVWPDSWVRENPQCTYESYETTVSCTLVKNLPDIKTENNDDVDIPKQLADKWKAEGRYEQEMKELDAFFKRTGYPRAPKYYIIKWLTDYITEFGIDGYRADTVKHTEESVWSDFKKECTYAFEQWKANNPNKVMDDNDFYIVGEVYNYGISGGQFFDFGNKKVNYFENGFRSLINFEFKWDARDSYEKIFSKYNSILNNELKNYGTLNYLSSHDDGEPFDKNRDKSMESATKLLLSPGSVQIYYGDESARSLTVEGTVGDATLRSNMNWNDIASNNETKTILAHWQKLGKFRNMHPAIGAGSHKMIHKDPYFFQRIYKNQDFVDVVLVGLDMPEGEKIMDVNSIFKEGVVINDGYSGTEAKVINGKVSLNTPFNIVLLEKKN